MNKQNKLIIIGIIMLLAIMLFSNITIAYNGDKCTETHSPCGGGCTSTDLSSMYKNYDFSTDPDGVGDISGWNTSCVTNMSHLFDSSNFNQNISDWDVSNVTDMSWMFTGDDDFNQNINNWNVSKVTDMSYMFGSMNNFNQPLNNWDVSHVTDMTYMFNTGIFNQNINNWNVSNVISMDGMFGYNTNFNQPLNDWDVSHVTNMHQMFLYTSNFNQPLDHWDVQNVTDMNYMFYQSSFNQPLQTWEFNKNVNLDGMFRGDDAFNNVNIFSLTSSDLTDFNSLNLGMSSTNYKITDLLASYWLRNKDNGFFNTTSNYNFGSNKHTYLTDGYINYLETNRSLTYTDGGLQDLGNITVINISTCQDLQNIDGGNSFVKYQLINDVDCADTRNWNNGSGFNPITISYSGKDFIFDGQGHKISNLFINRSSEDEIGLFKKVYCDPSNSRVIFRNVIFDNATIIGRNKVAVLLGKVYDDNEVYDVRNIKVINSHITASSQGAGIVAELRSYGVMNLSMENSVITAGPYSGGLLGVYLSQSNILNSKVTNCTFNFNGGEAGGLIGFCPTTGAGIKYSKVENTNLYAHSNYVGALSGDNCNLFNSYVINSNVYGDSGIRVGGLQGKTNLGNVFSHLYFVGNVTGITDPTNTAHNQGPYRMKEVYYASDKTSEQLLGTALTSSNMLGKKIFSDFDNTKWKQQYDHYPELRVLIHDVTDLDGYDLLKINSCDDLQSLEVGIERSNILNGKTYNFELTKNIDCSKLKNTNKADVDDGFGFEPLYFDYDDYSNYSFSFNGNNHTINNLFMDRTGGYASPIASINLFGNFSFFNVTFINETIKHHDGFGTMAMSYLAGLVSKITNPQNSNFYNINFTNITIFTDRSVASGGNGGGNVLVGGVIGNAYSNVNIHDVGLYNANLTLVGDALGGDNYIGGIVGVGLMNYPLNNADFIGTIYTNFPSYGIAGIVGYYASGVKTINNCTSKGFVYSGYNGTQTGRNGVAGLIGRTGNIYNSYYQGNITCIHCDYGTGSLLGYGGGYTINDSYFVGMVYGDVDNDTSRWNGGMKVQDSYYDNDVGGRSLELIPKTTSEMKSVSTFNTWDTSVWNLRNGQYPELMRIESQSPKPIVTESKIVIGDTEITGYCKGESYNGHNITYNYEWYVNGNLSLNGTSTETQSGIELNIGSTSSIGNIVLSCQVNDSEQLSDKLNSTQVTTCSIGNETCGPCGGGLLKTDLSGMYAGKTNFNTNYGDITGWNTSCVTNMASMFFGSDFNQNINNWDVSKVTNMHDMFHSDNLFNQPLNNWDVGNVTDISYMFFYATNFNQYLNNWDTHSLITAKDVFGFSSFDQDLSNWDVSHVTNMEGMFYESVFSHSLNNWNFSSVINMNGFIQKTNSPFNITNYDGLLLALKNTATHTNVPLRVDQKYSISSIPTRDYLVNNMSWTITDLGPDDIAPIILDLHIEPENVSSHSTMIGVCKVYDENDAKVNVSYKWYKNGIPMNIVTDLEVNSNTTVRSRYDGTLNVGDNWTFYCNVKDKYGEESGEQSVKKTVIYNTKPTVTAILTNPLYDSEDMYGYCKPSDLNNDNTTIIYSLFNNGVLYINGSYDNVSNNQTKEVVIVSKTNMHENDNWTLSCKAYDSYDYSDENNVTETVLRKATPPVVTYNHIDPIILVKGKDNISVNVKAVDYNDDPFYFIAKLYINNTLIKTQESTRFTQNKNNELVTFNITNITFNTNDEVWVNVTAKDVDNESQPLKSQVIIVRDHDVAPVITSIRMSPSASLGEDDNVAGYCKANDTEGDLVNFKYYWYVNNTLVKEGTVINPNNKYGYPLNQEVYLDTLTHDNYNQFDNVTFGCKAYDVKNISDEVNITQVVFGPNNFPPTIQTIEIIPSSGPTTQTFTIRVNGTDLDSSQLKYEYRIIKNGNYLDIKTSDWYGTGLLVDLDHIYSSDTKATDNYYVKVRAYDGNDYSDWFTSNPITIENTKPQITLVNITTPPYENNNLNVDCEATDIDTEQTLTYYKKWYKDGVEMYEGDVLPSSLTSEGDHWFVRCIANDGIDNSTSEDSQTVTIIATHNPPVVNEVNLTGGINQLVGKCKSTDADGNNLDYTIKLYKNGTVINSQIFTGLVTGTTKTVTYNNLNLKANDIVMLSCYVTDNRDGNNTKNSSQILVPSFTFDSLVTKTTMTTAKVEWSGNYDKVKVYLDNVLKAETSTISWTFEGLQPDTNYTIKLIPVINDFDGDSYYHNITTKESDNNPPVMLETKIIPSFVYTNTPIRGECRGTDLESYNLYYTYDWKVNNVTVKSGVTELFTRNTTVDVGSLLSTKYKFNDTVTLQCQVHDSLVGSEIMNDSIVVQNTPPTIEDELIKIELDDNRNYVCEHSYSDDDNDPEINVTYDWWKNGIEQNFTHTKVYPSNEANVNDKLVCTIHTGDAYHNITKNSSVFTVGDFEKPVISSPSFPTSVYTDTSVLLSTYCSDNLGVANNYPKLTFINPNHQEETYQYYYEGDNLYQQYHTFNIPGTYTNFEIICKDGNGNTQLYDWNGTIVAKVRDTIINIGGGAGSSEDQEPFRNITSFKVTPMTEHVVMTPGSTNRIEFQIENTDITDLDFTVAILNVGKAYKWMSFDNNLRAITFGINKENGLSANNKYIRYNINIPDDTPVGDYKGEIEINAMGQTKVYQVEIEVAEGKFTRLMSVLDKPIITLPVSLTPSTTGAVTGAKEDSGVTNITPKGLIITTGIGGLIFFIIKKAMAFL